MPDRGITNKFPYVGEMVRSELVENLANKRLTLAIRFTQPLTANVKPMPKNQYKKV